jgi:hypothetical protein
MEVIKFLTDRPATEQLLALLLVGLALAWFYAYYARAARQRAQLAKLRRTIEDLHARERHQEARYEELLRRFHSLELSVNKMHQRIDFTLPDEGAYTSRRHREPTAPLRPPGSPSDPLTPG